MYNAQANRIGRAQLGQRIRTLRKARRLSQSALASLCRLYTDHIGKIERGAGNPTLDTLIAIATVLRTTPGDLLAGLSFFAPSRQVQEAAQRIDHLHSASAAELTRAS